jgi:hypothetical protein
MLTDLVACLQDGRARQMLFYTGACFVIEDWLCDPERLRTISMTRSWSAWLILEPEGKQSP